MLLKQTARTKTRQSHDLLVPNMRKCDQPFKNYSVNTVNLKQKKCTNITVTCPVYFFWASPPPHSHWGHTHPPWVGAMMHLSSGHWQKEQLSCAIPKLCPSSCAIVVATWIRRLLESCHRNQHVNTEQNLPNSEELSKCLQIHSMN